MREKGLTGKRAAHIIPAPSCRKRDFAQRPSRSARGRSVLSRRSWTVVRSQSTRTAAARRPSPGTPRRRARARHDPPLLDRAHPAPRGLLGVRDRGRRPPPCAWRPSRLSTSCSSTSGLGLLLPVPPPSAGAATQASRSLPPALGEGYAILRPLHLDPKAHLPIVTLRLDAPSDEPVPACRFALVGLLAKDASASGLLEGLGEAFADAHSREASERHPRGRRRDGAAACRSTARAPVREHAAPAAHGARGGSRPDGAPGARRLPGAPRLHRLRGGERRGRAADRRRTASVAGRDGGAARRRERHRVLPRACARTACCAARRSCSSPSGTTATPATRRSRRGADDYLVKPAPSREHLVRLELVLRRFAADGPRRAAGSGPARRGRADGRARGAADLQPQPAHRRAGRAARQPVAADRLPPRPDRLGHRARPPRRRRRLRFHRLAPGPVRVRPRRGSPRACR